MKVAVTANGTDLDARISPLFGRCSTYILVDTETMEYETIANPAVASGGGAGIQAAQFIVERGAEAVVTGNGGHQQGRSEPGSIRRDCRFLYSAGGRDSRADSI